MISLRPMEQLVKPIMDFGKTNENFARNLMNHSIEVIGIFRKIKKAKKFHSLPQDQKV